MFSLRYFFLTTLLHKNNKNSFFFMYIITPHKHVLLLLLLLLVVLYVNKKKRHQNNYNKKSQISYIPYIPLLQSVYRCNPGRGHVSCGLLLGSIVCIAPSQIAETKAMSTMMKVLCKEDAELRSTRARPGRNEVFKVLPHWNM